MPRGPLLTVTPKEFVAPICSEVIVAAGLCDSRGYFLTGQPIEWMIPDGSIGEIVQVGKETHTGFTSYLRGSPHKVATNYVRAYTSSIGQTIDRGTPSPLDDVSLGKGQSWISVTSPIEGTTHVTVWAPKEKDWERRRTTARIHWVDAKWTFPPPQVSRFGQPVRLTTRIMRSNGAPVANWIVRYDILGGPEASFGGAGAQSIAPTTGPDGTATAELLPNATTAGITQLRVQIVRPSTGRDGLPDMVVGQGLTSVTWSTPGLQVRAAGPESVPIDGTASYRVEVANNGDMIARDVKLSFTPPRSVSVLSTSPQASPLGQTLLWRLGDMQPRTTTVVEVNCRPTMAADIRAVFRAESADRLVSEVSVSTRVFASALSVRMTGPESTEVGQTAQFQIELTNTSRTAMTNIRVRDTYDPGLTEASGKRSPLEFTIDQLQPGQTYPFAVTFTVNEPGKHSHRLDITADGGHAASARGSVTGVAAGTTPMPRTQSAELVLNVTAPAQMTVGRQINPDDPSSFTGAQRIKAEVTNNSSGVLTNVRVQLAVAASLLPLEASEGAQQTEEGAVYWTVPQLRPGEKIAREVLVGGAESDPQATISVTVVSDQTAEQSKEATIRVVAPAAVPPMGTKGAPGSKTGPMGAKAAPATPPATTANANNLTIGLGDLPDPVRPSGEVAYLLEVTNSGTAADADIVFSLTMPAGFTLKSVAESTGKVQLQSVGGIGSGRYELTPIAALKPGEKFGPITLKAVAGRTAGKGTLKVIAISRLNPRGLEKTVETTVRQ